MKRIYSRFMAVFLFLSSGESLKVHHALADHFSSALDRSGLFGEQALEVRALWPDHFRTGRPGAIARVEASVAREMPHAGPDRKGNPALIQYLLLQQAQSRRHAAFFKLNRELLIRDRARFKTLQDFLNYIQRHRLAVLWEGSFRDRLQKQLLAVSLNEGERSLLWELLEKKDLRLRAVERFAPLEKSPFSMSFDWSAWLTKELAWLQPPSDLRDLLILRYWCGWTPTEIARETGIDLQAAQILLDNGLLMLRKRLGAQRLKQAAAAASLASYEPSPLAVYFTLLSPQGLKSVEDRMRKDREFQEKVHRALSAVPKISLERASRRLTTRLLKFLPAPATARPNPKSREVDGPLPLMKPAAFNGMRFEIGSRSPVPSARVMDLHRYLAPRRGTTLEKTVKELAQLGGGISDHQAAILAKKYDAEPAYDPSGVAPKGDIEGARAWAASTRNEQGALQGSQQKGADHFGMHRQKFQRVLSEFGIKSTGRSQPERKPRDPSRNPKASAKLALGSGPEPESEPLFLPKGAAQQANRKAVDRALKGQAGKLSIGTEIRLMEGSALAVLERFQKKGPVKFFLSQTLELAAGAPTLYFEANPWNVTGYVLHFVESSLAAFVEGQWTPLNMLRQRNRKFLGAS